MKSMNNQEINKGFTFIELLITIVILGIFGAVALTRIQNSMDPIKVQVAIDQISTDIDLIRTMAFARHETLTMVFDVENDSYTVYTGPDGDRSAVTDFPNSTNGIIAFQNARFSGVDITAASFNNSQPEIQFLPLGDVKSGGTITINTRTITLQDLTGKLSVN